MLNSAGTKDRLYQSEKGECQLYLTIAVMMLTHIHVRRWLVKLSAQAGGRGHLYLDAHDFHWHRQAVRREKQWGAVPWDELSTHNDVLCFCAELSYVLPMKAKFARACEAAYGTWARFLAELMLSGGIIEAHPNGAVPDLTPVSSRATLLQPEPLYTEISYTSR